MIAFRSTLNRLIGSATERREPTMGTHSQPTKQDYFTGDDEARAGWERLRHTADPHERAQILERDAEIERHKARLHTAVFGPHPVPGEDRDLADCLADSTAMLWIVAQAERARVNMCSDWSQVDDRTTQLSRAVLADYNNYAAGLITRQEFLEGIRDTWYPMVGSQAVETICRLPVGPPDDDLDKLILDTRAGVVARLDAATDFDAVLADIYRKALWSPLNQGLSHTGDSHEHRRITMRWWRWVKRIALKSNYAHRVTGQDGTASCSCGWRPVGDGSRTLSQEIADHAGWTI